MSLVAIGLGILSTLVAWVLVRLIGRFTNLAFYQRVGTDLVSPTGNHPGSLVGIIPVIGGIIVDLA